MIPHGYSNHVHIHVVFMYCHALLSSLSYVYVQPSYICLFVWAMVGWVTSAFFSFYFPKASVLCTCTVFPCTTCTTCESYHSISTEAVYYNCCKLQDSHPTITCVHCTTTCTPVQQHVVTQSGFNLTLYSVDSSITTCVHVYIVHVVFMYVFADESDVMITKCIMEH